MSTLDDADAEAPKIDPAENQLLARAAAHWVTVCAEDTDDTAGPRPLLAWLRRSPRHVRAFLLAESYTIGLLAHANRSGDTSGTSIEASGSRRARFERNIELLRPILGAPSRSNSQEDPPQSAPSVMGSPASGTPRFLSQAVRDGKLSAEQAQEVFDTQAKERRYEGRYRKAGQIAAERGYLKETDPDEIEHARRQSAGASPDLLQHPTERGGRRLAFAIQNVIALAVLSIAIGTHPATGNNVIGWLQVVVVGALFGSLVISLLPRRAYLQIRHPAVLSAMYLLRNSAVFAGPIAISALLVLAGWTVHDLLAPRQAPLVALVLLSTSAVGISAAFQAHVKDYFEWREDAFSRIEERLFTFLRERRGDITGVRKEILETAARVLKENPWMQLSRRFVRRFKGPATVAIWYLSPNSEQNCFNIAEITTVDAPGDVQEILATVRASHHPKFLDESVTVREWIARAVPNLRGANISHLSKLSKACLDYRAVVAFPVFADREQTTPASMLLAFSNVPNGFTDADLAAIRRVTRLLTLLPNKATAADRARKSAAANQDSYDAPMPRSLEPPNIVTNFLWPLGQMVFGRHTLAS